MRGGKIIRSTPTSKWFIVIDSDDDLVNDYRRLELSVLNRFLLNSTFTDSNEALENNGRLLVANFRADCMRAQQSHEDTVLFDRLVRWRNAINAIIRLRTQGIEDNRIPPELESEKEKGIREGHEKRRDYWLPIRAEIHRLVENAREHIRIKTEMAGTAAADAAEAVDAAEVAAAEVADVPYEPTYETVQDDEAIAEYLSEIESREEARNRMIRERREIERAEAASAKQYAAEQAARLAEVARAEQSARDKKRNEDLARKAELVKKSASAVDAALAEGAQRAAVERVAELKKTAIEEDAQAQRTKKQTYITEKEALLAKAKETLKTAKKEVDKNSSLYDEHEEIQKIVKKQLDDYNRAALPLTEETKSLVAQLKTAKGPERVRLTELFVKNQKKQSLVIKIHEEIDKSTQKRDELRGILGPIDKKWVDAKAEVERLEGILKELSPPNYHLCHNPACFNHGKEPCNGCNAVYYCGVECKRADWKSHKPLCAADFESTVPVQSVSTESIERRRQEETRLAKEKHALKLCDNDGCYKEGKYPCSGCRAVRYCSKECQIVDWKLRHKDECTRQYTEKKEKGGTKRKVKTRRRKTRKYK
jgi:hypothetical protein